MKKVIYCPLCGARFIEDDYPDERHCPYCKIVFIVELDSKHKELSWTEETEETEEDKSK